MKNCHPLPIRAALFVLKASLALSLSGAGAVHAQDDGWNWDLALYLWPSNITIDAGDDRTSVDFKDLVDKLESAFAAHFEGRRGKGGFLVDVMLVSVADDALTEGHPDLPDGSLVELDVDQGLYEVGGFYRPGGQEDGFDVLAGVRLLQLDDALTVTLPIGASDTEKSDSSFTDGFIGVRYSDRLSNRLGYQIRIDFASGDTDSTWNTVAGLTVGVGKKGNKNLIFGYRRLDFDLKDQEVESQLEMSGPFFAFNVGF